MDTTQLPDYHVFQGPHSDICGPCSLAMVYSLKGKPVTLDDVLRDFKLDHKGKPMWASQLIRHLHKNGLATTLTVSTSRVASPAWANLSKVELIENLKTWLTLHPKDDWHFNNMNVLFYLQEGGQLNLASYTASSLKAMLDNGSMLILCIDEDWVWGHRLDRSGEQVRVDDLSGYLEGHFVVVTGYEGNMFHVLDPYPTNIEGRHGMYDVEEERIVNASLTWDPQVIEILK